jgi:hypothetical protein
MKESKNGYFDILNIFIDTLIIEVNLANFKDLLIYKYK